MREEFRTVQREGFEHYEVSNLGSVRNSKTGKMLKPSITKSNNCETYTFNAKNKDKVTRMSVAREVARAFFNDFNDSLIVKHRDGDVSNNIVDNLMLEKRTRYSKVVNITTKNDIEYNSTIVAENAINALKNLQKLMLDIERCKENIVAYDKFSQDILHDIEMNDMNDDQLLTKVKMIKDVRGKRRYNKNVEIISEFISKQMSSTGLSSSKIDMMISKLQNAKAKLEATESGKAYNRRFDELNEVQKQVIEEEVLRVYA